MDGDGPLPEMAHDAVILVADDDPGHRELVRRNLQRSGFEDRLLMFGGGQQALAFLKRSGPAPHREAEKQYILLLDIRMPSPDGVEVLEAIRSDDDLRALPVIMLTTTEDPVEVRRCHELGCNSYIAKPVEYDAFVNAVQRLGGFLRITEIPRI
jgi:CheY-like chemotaxis protein